jgi:hypothetical protein
MTTSWRYVLSIIGVSVVVLWAIFLSPQSSYSLLSWYGVLFCLAIFLSFLIRGRGRIGNGLLIVATILFCLGVIEGIALSLDTRPLDRVDRDFVVPRGTLGWGPGHPGSFNHKKTERRTGRIIFDVTYTIDDNLNRQVTSSKTGPVIAFFGDSMTFGWGLPDSETLPQAFADATGRRFPVYNLAMPGFGPHQFLRALETDMYDSLLRDDPKLFVYLTAPWQAQRTSCREAGPLAPSYELRGDQPVYAGSCYQRASTFLSTMRTVLNLTSTFRVLFPNAFIRVTPDDIELYIHILMRAGELARQKYNTRTLILFQGGDIYLNLGYPDAEIMRRLREGGLDVIDATLNQSSYPDQPLRIPGDGHPAALTNRIRAEMVQQVLQEAGKPQ